VLAYYFGLHVRVTNVHMGVVQNVNFPLADGPSPSDGLEATEQQHQRHGFY